jgi:predicted Rossmann fold nucleotide-binding protein DprA/Smf involved in DNA uptake
MAAHAGALDADGETMAILPFGLARFAVRRALRGSFAADRFLALSELPPAWGFSVRHAHRRNSLLVAHARAVIVVEPGESGGTWSTIARAKKFGAPFFFHEGERADLVGSLTAAGGQRIVMDGCAPLLGPVMACMEPGG